MADKNKKDDELPKEPIKEETTEEKKPPEEEKEPLKKESLEKTPGDTESVSGELIVEVSQSKSYGWIFVLGLLLVLVIAGGGLLFYFKGIENVNLPAGSKAPTSTPVPTEAKDIIPTATPSAKLDREEFGIEVMNGSGRGGQAAAMQKILEDAGFKVDSIGNADKSDYAESVISVKDGVSKEFLAELQKELGKEYVLSDETGKLGKDADSDVEIIVGSERAE